MKVNLLGVRGSIPTTGPETKGYGGQTSCVLVSEDDQFIILDAGSGIQALNKSRIAESKRIDIVLSHLHMDHIQGLGFFKPLFIPDLEVHIWGPSSNASSLRSRLGRYLSPPLFPVGLQEIPCRLEMHEIGNSAFEIGDFKVQSTYVIHPGPTLGFRITSKNISFTYIPDHEPALGMNGMINDTNWISGFNLAREADLLYHDGQYTGEEYATRKGWGHSSYEDALEFAAKAKSKRTIVGHHDPNRTDGQLDDISRELNRKAKQLNIQCEMAVERNEYTLK